MPKIMPRCPASLLAAILTLPLLGLGTFLVSAAVHADEDHDVARRLRQAGDILPLETLLARAQRAYPQGRVIETELKRRDGRWVYEIELLERGVVHELHYDARSGDLLQARDKPKEK